MHEYNFEIRDYKWTIKVETVLTGFCVPYHIYVINNGFMDVYKSTMFQKEVPTRNEVLINWRNSVDNYVKEILGEK